MNARDWTTLVMRLVGLVLIASALLPLVTGLMMKVNMLTGGFPASSPFSSLLQWMSEFRLLVQLGLGFYFLFGGKWVIRVLFRGLGGKAGYCPHCDYDVRGLAANRCPECGKRIRPEAE